MKLIYLAHTPLPSGWAHSFQIMKMCEAFAQNGVEVTLVVPSRRGMTHGDVFNHYGVTPIFRIVRVPYLDISPGNPGALFFWLRYISFFIAARAHLFFVQYDLVYTRELYAVPFFRRVVVEQHSFPKHIHSLHRFIFRAASHIVVLTSFIKLRLQDIGIASGKILVAPDGVRLEDFEGGISQSAAREKLQLPTDSYIVGYVGTLKTMGMDKGVSAAISSLSFLPRSKFMLYIVGGEVADIQEYQTYAAGAGVADRVVFAGKVPHTDVPLHIAACNCLVAPFPENQHYSYYMSPLKIFEYMAGKRPIIATKLPSIMEVLRENENAVLIAPGDVQSLATAIMHLADDSDYADKIVDAAYREVVQKYTWKQRANHILSFVRT